VAALAAGCDIALYCKGDFAPTEDLLQAVPSVTPATERRLDAARALLPPKRQILDVATLTAERAGLLA
jgi:beta-N-acetylhexosaminidase